MQPLPKRRKVQDPESNGVTLPMDIFQGFIIPHLGLQDKKMFRLVSKSFRDILDSKFLVLCADIHGQLNKEKLLNLPPNLHSLKVGFIGIAHMACIPENLKHLECLCLKVILHKYPWS